MEGQEAAPFPPPLPPRAAGVLQRFPTERLAGALAVDVLSVKTHAKTVMQRLLPPDCARDPHPLDRFCLLCLRPVVDFTGL